MRVFVLSGHLCVADILLLQRRGRHDATICDISLQFRVSILKKCVLEESRFCFADLQQILSSSQ